MRNWETKFSDTLGMIYNNFCHNLNFKSNSKLKNWSSDDVMVISNNETNVILDFEKGFYNRWISGFYQLSHFGFNYILDSYLFSEVPKEVQFWLGAREKNWVPDNILNYNATYYEMLELNSMMKLMQSVFLLLLMLFL